MQESASPIVHLFVGTHKTGTTSIRWMLDFYADLFTHYGYHIPRKGWTHYIDNVYNGGHNNVAWEIAAGRPIIPEYGGLTDLVQEIRGMPDRQHIVFSEDFDHVRPQHMAKLKEAFSDFDVHVIIFIRNQADWLAAYYAEAQKWFHQDNFDAWFASQFEADHRLDLHALCQLWADSFDAITIRPYEQIKSRVFDAFLKCCHAPAEMRDALTSRALPMVNPTPGDFPLELIRHTSGIAKRENVPSAYYARFGMPVALLAAQRLDLYFQKRSPLTEETAKILFAFMQEKNRLLADRFGLALGPEYLHPSLPVSRPEVSPPIDMDHLAESVMAICCDMTTDLSLRLRKVVNQYQGPDHAPVIDELTRIVDLLYPWPQTDEAAGHLLNELLANILGLPASGLCLESNAEGGVALYLVEGCTREVRKMDKDEWASLMRVIYQRALMNVTVMDFPKEGCLVLDQEGKISAFRVLSTSSGTGTVSFIKPRSPDWGL